jgi:hypothetical protein
MRLCPYGRNLSFCQLSPAAFLLTGSCCIRARIPSNPRAPVEKIPFGDGVVEIWKGADAGGAVVRRSMLTSTATLIAPTAGRLAKCFGRITPWRSGA